MFEYALPMIKKKCKCCGKTFYTHVGNDWAYKIVVNKTHNTYFYCSWSCLRKAQKEIPIRGYRKRNG